MPSSMGKMREPSWRARAALSEGGIPTRAHSSGEAQRRGWWVSGQRNLGRKRSIQVVSGVEDMRGSTAAGRGGCKGRWELMGKGDVVGVEG